MVTIHTDHQRFTTTRSHDSFRIRPRTPTRAINVRELADVMNLHITTLSAYFAFIAEKTCNNLRSGITELEPCPPDAEIRHGCRFVNPVNVKSSECSDQRLLPIALDDNLKLLQAVRTDRPIPLVNSANLGAEFTRKSLD